MRTAGELAVGSRCRFKMAFGFMPVDSNISLVPGCESGWRTGWRKLIGICGPDDGGGLTGWRGGYIVRATARTPNPNGRVKRDILVRD
jgi:hypothetical protein